MIRSCHDIFVCECGAIFETHAAGYEHARECTEYQRAAKATEVYRIATDNGAAEKSYAVKQ